MLTHKDTELSDFLNKGSPGYFIELGAYDGFRQSNTKFLEIFLDWKGLLIEPNPIEVNFCRLSRKSSTKVVHAACVSYGFSRNEVIFESLDLMSFSKQLALDVDDVDVHEMNARKHLRRHVMQTFSAPANTLDNILSVTQAPLEIDFLSLDCEGAELEVLRGLDLELYKVHAILVETRNLNSISDYLGDRGYMLEKKMSHSDYLFVRL